MTILQLAFSWIVIRRLGRALAPPTLLALTWVGLLFLAVTATPTAQTPAPSPFTVEAATTITNYPTVAVTVTGIVSRVVSQAFENDNFKVCEALAASPTAPRHCRDNLDATALARPEPYRLLVVLDKSLPVWNQPSWAAVTQSVASLIQDLGLQDQISILPFSHEGTIGKYSVPPCPDGSASTASPNAATEYGGSAWTSNHQQALAYLNNIRVDASYTALNRALDHALLEATCYAQQKIRIVVIADRLDNTVADPKRFQQLQRILTYAKAKAIPIDLFCYGAPCSALSSSDLPGRVEATGRPGEAAKLEIFSTATELADGLLRIRNLLKRYPSAFTFQYRTKFPANGKEYQLDLTETVSQSVASTYFTLTSLPMTPVLYLQDPSDSTAGRIPLTSTYVVKWAAGNQYQIDIATVITPSWPLSFVGVRYDLAIGDTFRSYGPYADPAASIQLNITLPSSARLQGATVRTTVTDTNGNVGVGAATLRFLSPPTFSFQVEPRFTQATITQSAVLLTLTLSSTSDLSVQDQVTITGDATAISPTQMMLGAPQPLTHTYPVSIYGTSGFFNELSPILDQSWQYLLCPTCSIPPAEFTLQACLARDDANCQQAIYQIQPPDVRPQWRALAAAWFWSFFPWLLLLLAVPTIFTLLDRMLRHTSIEIPIQIHNRGELALPCYLQAQVASQSNVRLEFLNGKRTVAAAVAPQPRPTPVPANQATPTPATATPADQRWARRLRISQARVVAWRQRWASFWGWFQRPSASWPRLKTVRTLLFGDSTAQPSVDQTPWAELPTIQPGASGQARLRVESLARQQRSINVIVRSSPDQITETCEYELEIRLGGVWQRPAATLIRPKPL